MKTNILRAKVDDESGMLGLILEGVRVPYGMFSVASEGVLIAHDLIEHVNGLHCIGSIDDELEALGAIWYVRGQHSDLSRTGRGSMYSGEQNIGADVARMFVDFALGGQYIDSSPIRTRACEADDALREIIECGKSDGLTELRDSCELAAAECGALWDTYATNLLGRLRTGYRKARRKWEPLGRFAANSQFWAIAEAAEPYAKSPEYEGAEYRLTWGGGEAHCSEYYPEEDY